MSDYRPPLRDIEFVLEHIVDIQAVSDLDGFDHVDPDTVRGLLEEAGRFMSEVVAPTNRIGDVAGAVRNDDGSVTVADELVSAYRQYVAAGWNGVKSSPEFGGHGFPTSVALAVQEMLTSANMALSLCPMLTMSAILALENHGTDEQKATYLEKLITGEWTGTMVLTEPEAGSDVGALRTRAEPQPDGSWKLFGTKIFITWGEHEMTDNIVHLVLARGPDAPPGTKGISLFIVPKLMVAADGTLGEPNDVTCVSIEHKLGIHSSPTCVMSFGEDRGAVGYLIGELHQGMRYMFTMMNDARLNVGLEGVAVAERAYQLAVDWARERRQGRATGTAGHQSSPIIEHPDVRRMILTMKGYVEAMRGLLYDTAKSIDFAGHHPDPEVRAAASERASLLTPVAKAWCTDLGVEISSLGIQVHGGMGFVEETGAAQFYRDSRIAPIYEGTNGIQAIDLVLRKVPLDGGSVVHGYLAEIDEVAAALAEAIADDGAPLDGILTGVEEGAQLLRNATDWILSRKDPRDALAGATPYLRLFGTVAGAAYLARQALAAHRATATGGDGGGNGDDFLAAKIATARFYCEQILPQAFGLVPAITSPATSLFEIEPELLAP